MHTVYIYKVPFTDLRSDPPFLPHSLRYEKGLFELIPLLAVFYSPHVLCLFFFSFVISGATKFPVMLMDLKLHPSGE